MGHQASVKVDRRAVRRVIKGEVAAEWFDCYEVIKMRGFWGRMKWLVLGR